jgi:hypothetical protein
VYDTRVSVGASPVRSWNFPKPKADTSKDASCEVFFVPRQYNMESESDYFNKSKEKAFKIFFNQKRVYCPYFKTDIILNSDGFHHLQFSSRQERDKRAQLLRFSLLPLAFEIIKKSGTVQEYRKLLSPVGSPSPRDGSIQMKEIEYWGFVAIVGENKLKVRTVLRRIGDGNITFWSVMPGTKIRHGNQKVFTSGIEDD